MAGKQIPYIDQAMRAQRALNDVGRQLDRISQRSAQLAAGIGRGLGEAATAADKLKASLSSLWNGFDMLGKGLIALNASIVGIGFGLLIKGIQKVYELKERWAKVTGMVTMKIGALTPNMQKLIGVSRQWQGTVRGLTDDFELGATMFTEYAATLETTGKHVKEFSRVGLQLARGFDLGGKGAGELTKVFRAMGANAGETAVDIVRMSKEAAILGVNSQQIVRELGEAPEILAEFGKNGSQAFLRATVYLRQFNVSLRDMQRFMDVFDTFDSATEATAKLNTIFGTTVSSLDMLLEQDPAARFEMVRRQLLAQGKTFEQISRYERKTLADTLKLSEREVAFMLDAGNAHVTLAEFREKAAKQQVSEREAQQKMQRQLRATAQTLFAFGAAMDKITMAIARALRPLLEQLGLVKSNSKEWKSFGSVMGDATNVIVRFFDGLAASPKWIALMQKLANAMRSFGKWAASLTIQDFADAFDKIVSFGEKFWKWSKLIIALWAGSKILGTIRDLGKTAANIVGAIGSGVGAVGGGAAKIFMPGGLPMGGRNRPVPPSNPAVLNRTHTALGGVGGALKLAGGMLGMVGVGLAPLLIESVGPAIIDAIGSLFDRESSHEKEMRHLREATKAAEERLIATQQKRARLDEKFNAMMSERMLRQKTEQRQFGDLEKRASRGKIKVSEEERVELAERIKELQLSGFTNKKLDKTYNELRKGAQLTTGQLANLERQSSTYYAELQKLSDQATAEAEKEMAKVRVKSNLELSKIMEKENEAKLADLKRQEEQLGKDRFLVEKKFGGLQKNVKLDENLNAAFHRVNAERLKLEKEQEKLKRKNFDEENSLEKKMFAIKYRQMIMSDEGFMDFMRTSPEAKGLSRLEAFRKFMGGSVEELGRRGFNVDKETFAQMSSLGMAEGGIVTRPTAAMVGEAGPEAVIPLKAMAYGSPRFSSKFGGEPARKMVNYASGGGGDKGTSKPVVVAGDVYLDGAKVGRHLVRGMLSNSTR